jgi:hypothetical protein
MIIYKEETDSWQYYENELEAGGYFNSHPCFVNGAGYGLLRATAGTIEFSGSLNNGNVSVPLVKTGNGWNLIGNPYSSAIKANDQSGDATTNFLKLNLNNMEADYAAIYLWEEGSDYNGETNYFRVITNGVDPTETPGNATPGQNFIQAGQGFFVKAASDHGSAFFTKAMQGHSVGTPLKSAHAANWYGLQLNVEASGMTAHTVVSFNRDMSKGRDVSYDAGLLRSGNGLEVYTRLVDDNGIDFAVQALPDSGLEQISIPLGIEYENGGELTISAKIKGLPGGQSFILEDKTTGILTDLGTGNYSFSLLPGAKGTGRFYLSVGGSGFTGIASKIRKTPRIEIRSANGKINIQGRFSSHAIARLFNLQGKLLSEQILNGTPLNPITLPVSAKGICFLQLIDEGWETTQKVVLY